MKTLLIISCLFLSRAAPGQPTLKVFAFSQEAVPGIVAKNVTDENGKPVERKKEPAANYYIFAGYSTSLKITIGDLWISGKMYRVSVKPVDSTPVIHINDNDPKAPVRELLAPSTPLRVVEITVKDMVAEKNKRPSWLISMIRNSDLVVSWYYKGKKYFTGVRKFKKLLPQMAI